MRKIKKPQSNSLVSTCSKCGNLKIRIYNKKGEKHRKVLQENKGLCKC